jgi:hypothetical protein
MCPREQILRRGVIGEQKGSAWCPALSRVCRQTPFARRSSAVHLCTNEAERRPVCNSRHDRSTSRAPVTRWVACPSRPTRRQLAAEWAGVQRAACRRPYRKQQATATGEEAHEDVWRGSSLTRDSMWLGRGRACKAAAVSCAVCVVQAPAVVGRLLHGRL